MKKLIRNVMDILASIAARDHASDIRAIIPKGDSENIDDALLESTRFRFCLLWGNAWSLVSDRERDQMLSYVEELEDSFQKEQEEIFGISAHKRLKPILSKQDILDSQLFHITGGLEEILHTTPDKAFVPQPLIDFILDDFRMVVSFVNAVGLIASEKGARELHNVRQRLISFSEKWNENNVLRYGWNRNDPVVKAQEFIRSMREIIEEVK